MKINIKLSLDIARILQEQEKYNDESEKLLRIVKKFGFILKPTHPGTNNPHLITYFNIQVPDPRTAEKVIHTLQKCKSIEAAYIKPLDELPSERN